MTFIIRICDSFHLLIELLISNITPVLILLFTLEIVNND